MAPLLALGAILKRLMGLPVNWIFGIGSNRGKEEKQTKTKLDEALLLESTKEEVNYYKKKEK